MDAKEFTTEAITRVRSSTLRTIKDLAPQQLYWRPGAQANSIAFLLWHVGRSEDRLLSNLRGKKEVWIEEEWYKRFGLPTSDTGNGWTGEQIGAFRPTRELVIGYMDRMREVALKTIGDLDIVRLKEQADPARANYTVANVLQGLISHESAHQGAMDYIAGLARSSGV